ncbi:hypothetical protein P9112_012330 [Eukaryota sp. TZLM1-RC]
MFSPRVTSLSNNAINIGSTFLKSSPLTSLSPFISKLKFYYTVSTSYCINKSKLLIWPLSYRTFSPRSASTERYPPNEDVHAPDLYIGTVSTLLFFLSICFSCFINSLTSSCSISFSTKAWLLFWSLTLATLVARGSLTALLTDHYISILDSLSLLSYSLFYTSLCRLLDLVMPSIKWLVIGYSCVVYAFYLYSSVLALIPDKQNKVIPTIFMALGITLIIILSL